MSLDSKWIKKIEEFLKRKGYPIFNNDLTAFGGRNNGTVDLMAKARDEEKTIIIEIKSNPIHIIDLSYFLSLKNKIGKVGDKKYYLLTCEYDASPKIIKIAKESGVIIKKIDDFLQLNKI